MKKVLIVDYHFPPVNNINARRFGEMAPYMQEFGWQPLVLTTKSRGSLPVSIPEENIIRLGENYYDEGKIIAQEGYRGVPTIFKLPYFFYRKLGAEIVSIDRFLFSWGREVRKEKEKIKSRNFDLIVASCYPPVAIWMGRFLSKEAKKPWVADLQDPLSLWNNSKLPLVKSLDKKIDKFLLKSASAVITISSHLAREMEKLYNRPVNVIYNGFDTEEPPKKSQTKEKRAKILYYAGRFHDHRMPAVKLLIDWLGQNKKASLKFVIRSLGPTGANKEIEGYAKEKGVADKIDILPPARSETIFLEEGRADALILFEDLNKKMENSEGTLPGKLMEYLPFRAQIIAINRSDSEIGEILKKTSRGYLVSSPQQLNEAMEITFNGSNPDFDWEKVNEYSRKIQCQKFCQILDKVYERENIQ